MNMKIVTMMSDNLDLYIANAMDVNNWPSVMDVALLSTTQDGTAQFPVDVYNINGVKIGTAATKDQYMTIWNSDSANRTIGTLYGAANPFSFRVEVTSVNNLLNSVLGNPANELIDSDGQSISDSDNSTILYQ